MTRFDALRDTATDAARQAHAPYSGFHVGAALLTASGRVHAGCNVENASFGVTGCAERGALAAAVLAEGSALQPVAIAIVAFDRDGRPQPAPPCGACRQALVEFGAGLEVGFISVNGEWRETTLDVLLPERFELDAG